MARNPAFKSISVKLETYDRLHGLVAPGGKVGTTLAWLVAEEYRRRDK